MEYLYTLPVGGLPPARKAEDYLQAYGEIGWLFAAVSRISSATADVDYYVERTRRDQSERVFEHPLTELLQNPNPQMTGTFLIEYTQMVKDLAGEAFWILNLNGRGLPLEIWPVPPNRMYAVPDKEDFLRGWLYKHGKQRVAFDASEVIHFRYPSPLDLYRGLGPVQALAVDLDSESYAAEWNRNFFVNSARPDAVLEMESHPSQEQREMIQQGWREAHRGVSQAHRIALLVGGTKYRQISVGHQEMGFPDLRRMNRDMILGIFGLSYSMLGGVENVNRANAEAQDYVFARYVIKPRAGRLCNAINKQLTSRFGPDLAVRAVDPTPENREQARLDAESGVRNGYMTINDARRLMSLPTLDPARGDVFLWPLMSQVVPASKAAVQVRVIEPRKLAMPKGLTQDEKDAAWEAFVKRADSRTMPWKAAVIKFYDKLTEEVQRAIRVHASRDVADDIWSTMASAWDIEEFLLDLSRPLLSATLLQAAEDAVQDYSLGIAFDLDNPRVQAWIGDRMQKFSGLLSDSAKADVTNQLRIGHAEGESIGELGARIQEYYDGNAEYKAERTARTEVINASGQGNVEAYRQAAIIQWEWYTNFDGRECDLCGVRHGHTYPITVNFEVQHANCRCSPLPVILED